MLNRLYIVLGVLLILVLGAAFVVPHFIDWSSRRAQMESIASEALGTKVEILGDIDFELLPQPKLRFARVIVGPAEDPFAEIETAEAEFSLTDFLRDRFAITKLTLEAPVLYLTLGTDGQFKVPLRLPETVSASNVSIADASIERGKIRLTDERLDQFRELTDLTGSLTLSALRGPFGLSGSGKFDGDGYQIRINTSQMNAEGGMQLAVFVRPEDGAFSLNVDGQLKTGLSPSLLGKATLRQSPTRQESEDTGRGDLVLDAGIDMNPDRVVLTNYVLVPDENRGSTRLTGAASVTLGSEPAFDAVISGGVVGLQARDAREDTSKAPYEFLRLLNELPAPLMPPIAGSLGIDLAELDLRSVSMRNVRVDARTDGRSWTIDNLDGLLPGDSAFHFDGTIAGDDGKPEVNGSLRLETTRLDALAQLWRKPEDANPLFRMPGVLAADISLANGALALKNGLFSLDGVDSKLALTVPLAGGALAVDAGLGSYDARQSDALVALLPDISATPEFSNSFSSTDFDISAEKLVAFGLEGQRLAARGSWSEAGLDFNVLSAGDLGGAGFTVSGTLAGSLADPLVTGSGSVVFSNRARVDVVPTLLDRLDADDVVRDVADGFLPGTYQFELAKPSDQGLQALSGDGVTDDVQVQFGANFGGGVLHFATAPMGVRVEVGAEHPEALLSRFGLPVALSGEAPGKVTFVGEGTLLNSIDAQATLTSAGDKLQYTGNLILSDPGKPRGRGRLEFDLAEPAVWGEPMGVGSIYLPRIKGVGDLALNGFSAATLTGLNFDAGGVGVTGQMSVTEQAGTPLVAGDLTMNAIELPAVAALMGGGSALIASDNGVWPDGPFAQGPARTTRGRVHVAAPVVRANGRDLAENAAFDVTWDDTSFRLRSGSADAGGGGVQFELGVCCSGGPAERQVTGRFGMEAVEAGAILPQPLAQSLGGKVTSSLQFSGTGDSIASVMASLNGEGSFTVSDLSVGGFDPDAFAVAGATPNILELDAEDMSGIVADALAKGAFVAPEMSGVMNLAGGALRSNNLGASAENADLFGSLAVDFNTLAVSGNWTLSPSGQVDAAGLINETTARIDSIIGGTLLAPSHTLDLVSMVDSVKVRAYELEVDRLEKLKAADEARQRAAAEERARLMAIEARRKAEAAAAELAAQRAAEREAAQRAAQQKLAEEQAAARKAAEEKAAAEKAAAEEAAAQAAAEQAAAEQAVAEQAAAEAAAEQAAQSQTPPTQVAPVAPDSSPVPGAPTDFTQPVTPPDPQALDLFLQDLEAETLNDLVPCGPSDAPVDLLGGGGVTTTPDPNCVVTPAQE